MSPVNSLVPADRGTAASSRARTIKPRTANGIIGSQTSQATHSLPTGTAPAFIYTNDLGPKPTHAKEKTARTGRRDMGMKWRPSVDETEN
jgi:hypothetical protein